MVGKRNSNFTHVKKDIFLTFYTIQTSTDPVFEAQYTIEKKVKFVHLRYSSVRNTTLVGRLKDSCLK